MFLLNLANICFLLIILVVYGFFMYSWGYNSVTKVVSTSTMQNLSSPPQGGSGVPDHKDYPNKPSALSLKKYRF